MPAGLLLEGQAAQQGKGWEEASLRQRDTGGASAKHALYH